MVFDGFLVPILVALGLATILIAPFVSIAILRHESQAALDNYGKFRGSGPAKSFVCPSCLTRSYAPSHIARRWCAKCERSFPEASEPQVRIKTWSP